LFANTLIDFSRAERCPRPINLAGGALPIRTLQKKSIYLQILYILKDKKSMTKYSLDPVNAI
jgi:hypothetical protein